jgi:hypothetical protein
VVATPPPDPLPQVWENNKPPENTGCMGNDPYQLPHFYFELYFHSMVYHNFSLTLFAAASNPFINGKKINLSSW